MLLTALVASAASFRLGARSLTLLAIVLGLSGDVSGPGFLALRSLGTARLTAVRPLTPLTPDAVHGWGMGGNTFLKIYISVIIIEIVFRGQIKWLPHKPEMSGRKWFKDNNFN